MLNMFVCRFARRLITAIPTSCTSVSPPSILNAPKMSTASQQSPPKKARSTPAVIGTHDGIFHCDEVLACFMLRQLPAFADATIVRTRDEAKLAECTIVVDVGATFDAAAARFDHHQREFQHTLRSLRPELGAAVANFNIRLSSAGLIYAHFGEQVLRCILEKQGEGAEEEKAAEPIDDEQLRSVYLKIYESLIQEIDGIDNGVPMFDAEPAYRISTDLSSRVATLNAPWNAAASAAPFDVAAAFERAQQLVGAEFVDRVRYCARSWLPARRIVAEAAARRHEVHQSGAILELRQFCPWKDHLWQLEQEQPEQLGGQPRYVLMENKPGDFRVICVPLQPKSFVCRRFLHRRWRGVRGAELERVSGVPGAAFVHATGFIGGAQTREAALQMAVGSLESEEPEEDGEEKVVETAPVEAK